MEIDDRVMAIEVGVCLPNVTLGNYYIVRGVGNSTILITDDSGFGDWYPKAWFEIDKPLKFNVGDKFVWDDDNELFTTVIKHLSNMEFVATSCSHSTWKKFYSLRQYDGGENATLESIEVVENYRGKITIKVKWLEFDGIAYVIFE